MDLAFRYQFALAPLVIVVLLACLVAYTLLELSNIHRENDVTVKWELLTDRTQVAIANVSLTDKLVLELIEKPLENDDERLFGYLEQTRILADSLQDPVFVGDIPEHLQKTMQLTESLLGDPELVDPQKIHMSLLTLLPALQYQHKLFLAQRRSAFIDYHRNLSIIVPRLSGALLTVLIACIVLAIGLTLWGLAVVRKRLKSLTQYAHSVSDGNVDILSEPIQIKDELDTLELSLARASKRLINVFAVEKILQGSEKERHRIAMDIHDGVLADLTALTRKIDTLTSSLSDAQLHELRSAADDITQSLRNTIDDLHPQTLHILGLEAALRSFLERQLRSYEKITYQFDFNPTIEDRLQALQKINLFRIITEAIHNVLRHAHCSCVELSVRVVSQQLIVTVEDDGVGMPNESGNLGHGCTNMIERARIIEANIVWRRSRFATGTCVEIKLPLKSS